MRIADDQWLGIFGMSANLIEILNQFQPSRIETLLVKPIEKSPVG
jgi:hypothetical protein